MKVKAGQLIQIDSGCYSDYSVHGFFVALQQFDPMAERKEWIGTLDADQWYDQPDFIAGLIRKGLLLEIDYDIMHLETYSDPTDFSYNGKPYPKETLK